MLSFQLPRVDPEISTSISYISSKIMPKNVISHSLSRYLSEIKEKVENREKEWDIFKKYTNPYEYIHSIVPNRRFSVSSHKALSSSYFKMVEMIRGFTLLPKRTFLNNNPIRTFHLGEWPGGFVEAVCLYRSNLADQYTVMTILNDDRDEVPHALRKSDHFIKTNPNVRIETGADNTGNIMNLANFDHCVALYGGAMDFITADGVIGGSEESDIGNFIWGQIVYALALQKTGGHFVLKMFDSFFQSTVDMMYILSAFYEEVHVVKLRTSRVGNSEKYLVCKRFRSANYLPVVRDSFIRCISSPDPYITRLLTCDLNRGFMMRIEEINSVFGQQQIENIYYTLLLIDKSGKHDRIEQIIGQNVQKCVQWCIEHGIYYNI